MGGAQSLHTNGYDEALALPTEASARLALPHPADPGARGGRRRTSVDPFGGSYAVESLTTEIETRRPRSSRASTSSAGMVAAIEAGFPSARSSGAPTSTSATWRRSGDHRGRERCTSRPTRPRARSPCTAWIPRWSAAARAARALPGGRDQAAFAVNLDALRPRAGDANLVPPPGRREGQATLGEIADRLRVVFGEHR
jgi:methylmalonyl-CoA mutase N-terminal domain/subunit